MKTIIRLIAVLFLVNVTTSIYSQQIGNLKGINYQAVALDHGQEIVGMDVEAKSLYKRTIDVRFSITEGVEGPTYYQETHETTTDEYGLFSLIIGQGDNTGEGTHDSLLSIPWIDANQFLKVEIAINNDGNYEVVSFQQFMTVPYSFYTDDIADDAITTNKILDETILPEDIGTGSVETSEILNETILAEDIGAGSVETSEILNSTILNEDIADATIDLTAKVQGILPVPNGGTGVNSLDDGGMLIGGGTGPIKSLPQAIDGEIAVGVTGSDPILKLLSAGSGIVVTNTADSVIISSSIAGGVNANGIKSISPGLISPGSTWISPAFPVPGGGSGAMGDIVLASIDTNLKGCMLTPYFFSANTIKIAIFNGTGGNVNLGTVNAKLLIVQ